MKIAFLMGTRPEVIKLAPLVKEAEARGHKALVAAVCQHTDLLNRALADFDLQPSVEIRINRENGTLSELASKAIGMISDWLGLESPDYVVVQGDTMTTFAAGFSAFLEKIPVVHVEAGLRTNNLFHPWPEEAIRQMVSRITAIHACPTHEAYAALKSESVEGMIELTGNTVVDAVHMVAPKNVTREKHVLVTLHRRENAGSDMRKILKAMVEFANRHPDWKLTWPKHPGVKIKMEFPENFSVIEPVGYRECLNLICKSGFVVTDSGGIQEEAGILGVPTLVCRETTERPESVKAGTSLLVGSNTTKVLNEMEKMTEDSHRLSHSNLVTGYGDGKAAKRIVTLMESSHEQ